MVFYCRPKCANDANKQHLFLKVSARIINEDGLETRSGRSGFVVDIVVLLQVSLSILPLLLSVSPYQTCILIFVHKRPTPLSYRNFQACKWKTSLFLLSKSLNLAVEWAELTSKSEVCSCA
jgi:hypothetical protein